MVQAATRKRATDVTALRAIADARALSSMDDYAGNYVGTMNISYDDLRVDHINYQRPINDRKIERILAAYHPAARNNLKVSYREADDTYWVMDGQHTREVEHLKGHDQIPCEVYMGLTIEQEAAIWRLNNTNKTTARFIDMFRSRVNEHEPVALAIKLAVERQGLHLLLDGKGGQRNPKGIFAVQSLENIYNRGEEKGYPGGGGQLIQDVLSVLRETWGINDLTVRSIFLQGVGIFFANCHKHPSFNVAVMPSRFKRMSATEVYTRATADARLEGGSGAYSIAFVLFKMFNRNLREPMEVSLLARANVNVRLTAGNAAKKEANVHA